MYIENTEEEKYKRPIKCPNGKVIPQIKFGSCGVELRPDNWQETHYVQIKATRDFKYDGARARFVNFDPILSLVHPIWTGYKLPTFEVGNSIIMTMIMMMVIKLVSTDMMMITTMMITIRT